MIHLKSTVAFQMLRLSAAALAAVAFVSCLSEKDDLNILWLECGYTEAELRSGKIIKLRSESGFFSGPLFSELNPAGTEPLETLKVNSSGCLLIPRERQGLLTAWSGENSGFRGNTVDTGTLETERLNYLDLKAISDDTFDLWHQCGSLPEDHEIFIKLLSPDRHPVRSKSLAAAYLEDGSEAPCKLTPGFCLALAEDKIPTAKELIIEDPRLKLSGKLPLTDAGTVRKIKELVLEKKPDLIRWSRRPKGSTYALFPGDMVPPLEFAGTCTLTNTPVKFRTRGDCSWLTWQNAGALIAAGQLPSDQKADCTTEFYCETEQGLSNRTPFRFLTPDYKTPEFNDHAEDMAGPWEKFTGISAGNISEAEMIHGADGYRHMIATGPDGTVYRVLQGDTWNTAGALNTGSTSVSLSNPSPDSYDGFDISYVNKGRIFTYRNIDYRSAPENWTKIGQVKVPGAFGKPVVLYNPFSSPRGYIVRYQDQLCYVYQESGRWHTEFFGEHITSDASAYVDHQGDIQLIARQKGQLAHYSRSSTKWNFLSGFSSSVSSAPSLLHKKHGNPEVFAVREGRITRYVFRNRVWEEKNSFSSGVSNISEVIDNHKEQTELLAVTRDGIRHIYADYWVESRSLLSLATDFWISTSPRGNLGYPALQKPGSREQLNQEKSTYLNGFLCLSASGARTRSQAACDAVKAAQDPATGQWWRTPLKERRPDGQKVSFNNSMLAGLVAYLAVSGDAPATKKWLTWLVHHNSSRTDGKLSFCSLDDASECYADEISRYMIGQLLIRLKLTADFPGLNNNTFPAETFKKRIRSGNIYDELNYLASVLLLLEKEFAVKEDLSALRNQLLSAQPENLFFRYLTEGSSESLKSSLLYQCPGPDKPVPESRSLWMWEVPTENSPGLRASGWDCLFLGNMLE